MLHEWDNSKKPAVHCKITDSRVIPVLISYRLRGFELVTAPLCALGSLTRWSFWGGGDVIGVIPVEKWSWRSLASALAAIVIVVAHVRKTLADDSRVSAGRGKPRIDSWTGALAEADNFISAILELRALYIWTHRTGDRCVSDSWCCRQQGWWVSVSCQTSSWIFFLGCQIIHTFIFYWHNKLLTKVYHKASSISLAQHLHKCLR